MNFEFNMLFLDVLFKKTLKLRKDVCQNNVVTLSKNMDLFGPIKGLNTLTPTHVLCDGSD